MGIITIAFDDGYADTFKHCAEFLTGKGVSATFAVPSACIGKTLESRPVMGKEDLLFLRDNDHEIASHTTGHRNLLDVFRAEGEDAVRKEMEDPKKNLEVLLGIEIRSFVFPFIKDNHSPELLDLAREYYHSSRITTEGFAFNKLPPGSRYSITGTAVTTDNPMDEYNKLVDIVSLKDLWLIEVFHLVSDKNTKSAHRDEPYRFFTHINTFRDHIRYILSKNIPIKTQGQVIAGS